MTSIPRSTTLARARAAADGGDWGRACDLLLDADRRVPLEGTDLVFLAEMAYAAGRPDVTIGAWERAHAEGLRVGDRPVAAGAAAKVALYLLFDTGLMAPVRGWVQRAERLLDGEPETPVHAWLAVVRAYERMLSGDLVAAKVAAVRAVQVGTACEPAAAALGRVAEARCLLLGGEVSDGLSLLNEAAVAAVSGELDPLSTGVVYCEVICALQALAQYDLAEEWTTAMEGWRHGRPVGSVHGRCRVHRAEIFRLRGAAVRAEEEVRLACQELEPYLGREMGWPLTELGRIRLQRGDLAGAEEAFHAAHEIGWDPQPGLALVRLAQGDLDGALRSIRDALEHPPSVPSKELPPNTDLRRAPLLAAQVEIEVAAGEVATARHVASELAEIAATFESRALAAAAASASGQVELAAGDFETARAAFERAVGLWTAIGAPYEAGRARWGLARVHGAAGNRARALLELRAARSSLERAGAVHEVAGVDVELAAVGSAGERGPRASEVSSLPVPETAEESVFRREGDTWCVTFGGQRTRLRDLKGLRYVAILLSAPGRDFLAVDLVARQHVGSDRDVSRCSPGSHAGELLDARAKDAYRRRLGEIDEDLADARALGDGQRMAQAESEREILARELSRAFGLGGRERFAGSASERARASVTRAIRRALDRLREHHPGLAEHLDHGIRTGTYCAYRPGPGPGTVWTL